MMTDPTKLGAVPDLPMVSLFSSLVAFLKSEANGRGWQEVGDRLAAVETALAGLKSDPSNGG